VHHGNGTEAIFWERPEVLTVSIHQERNYPRTTGGIKARGGGAGEGANLNVPLSPGGGHDVYLHAMRRLVLPALERFRPDLIVVACGFDASGVDPLGRMMATSETFAEMTVDGRWRLADRLCGGRVVMIHEGGYSEAHVPFCGHAVIERLAGSGDPRGGSASRPGSRRSSRALGRRPSFAARLTRWRRRWGSEAPPREAVAAVAARPPLRPKRSARVRARLLACARPVGRARLLSRFQGRMKT
jgi:acetoin utilization deacetylase AcuC-like enzyme